MHTDNLPRFTIFTKQKDQILLLIVAVVVIVVVVIVVVMIVVVIVIIVVVLDFYSSNLRRTSVYGLFIINLWLLSSSHPRKKVVRTYCTMQLFVSHRI